MFLKFKNWMEDLLVARNAIMASFIYFYIYLVFFILLYTIFRVHQGAFERRLNASIHISLLYPTFQGRGLNRNKGKLY